MTEWAHQTSTTDDEWARQRPHRIIVINDDTDFLTLMCELLTEIEGYDVQVWREGDRAYQFVKEQQPDLVILDIRIDGQERGWIILECLTLDPQTSSIPVIVCSAAIRELQAHAAELERYGIDTLSKPFDLEALLQKVTSALARSKRHDGIVALDGEAKDALQIG